MNRISRQLIILAEQIKKEQVLQEIDQYAKQMRDMWNDKDLVADFIVSAFLQQEIKNSLLYYSLVKVMTKKSFKYEGIDELSHKTYKSYSQIYSKIMRSVSKQTIQKMKKVDKKKLIQWVSKNFGKNRALASMRKVLFEEATKLGNQIASLKKKIKKQGIGVSIQNYDQFNFQINPI